jgi:hypothetical protein
MHKENVEHGATGAGAQKNNREKKETYGAVQSTSRQQQTIPCYAQICGGVLIGRWVRVAAGSNALDVSEP